MARAGAMALRLLVLVSMGAILMATSAHAQLLSPQAQVTALTGDGDTPAVAADIPILSTLALMAAEQNALGGGGNDPAPAVFTEDDELILLLRTQRLVLGDAITGYGTRSGVYLPLGELSRVLDLAINLGPEGDTASGWFLSENRTFSLSLSNKEVVIAGKTMLLAPEDAVARDGEIFVRTDKLAEWFPIKFDVSLSALEVRLTTLEPFPFETRLARDEARDRLASGRGGPDERLPFEATPFQVLSIPSLDVVARLAQSEQRGTEYQYDIRASGDLAFLAANLFVGGSDRAGLSAARLTLGRYDPDGGLLGPLRARQISLGDVFAPNLAMGPRSVGGRGGLISNVPLDRVSVFDRLDLRGALPSGYEVELYRNNVLIGSTKEARDGQYEFLQVPLDFGNNILRLVFFGPRGERQEQVRQVSVGDGRLSRGDFRYTIAAAQRETSLFEIRDNTRALERDAGSWEGSVQIDYGLSPFVTLATGLQRFEGFGVKADMAIAGIRTSLGGVALKIDAATQSPGGSAVQVGIGGRLAGLNYGVIHAEYSGQFLDEVRRPGQGFYTRQTDAQISWDATLGDLRIPLQLRAVRGEFADGTTDLQGNLRMGWTAGRLIWSNTLDYQSLTGPVRSQEQIRGSLTAATTRAGNGQIRAGLEYAIVPDFEATSINVNYDRDFGDDVRARFQVSQDLRSSATRFGASVSKLYRNYDVALDTFYDTKSQDYSIGIRVGFSLGRNPISGDLIQRRLGLAQGGGVAARVFKDLNANNVYDAGDEPVVGARVTSSGSSVGTTDENGVAFVGNVGENRRVMIALDQTSLENIYLQPTRPRYEILPRAGKVHITNIPLLETGEIEGDIRFIDRNGSRGVSAVRFNVIDGNGRIAGTGRSESDGYFLVEALPVGKYSILLDPEQSGRLNIQLSAPATFIILPGGTAVPKLRIEVQRR